jgi:hypothetical protein
MSKSKQTRSQNQKLKLAKETLRDLVAGQLKQVGGGIVSGGGCTGGCGSAKCISGGDGGGGIHA